MPKEQEIQIKLSGRVDSSYNKSISAASQKMSELKRGTKDVSQGFSDAEKSGKDFGAGSADAVSNLGSALAAAGIVMLLKETASAFFECAEAAEQYEYSLAKISTIADTTKVSMETVNNDIFSLSQETGQSVGDLSESVYQAMSASVDSADAVSFVADANKLAVGGFTDTTTAVDVLTTALNAYGLETSKAGEISDMLITTQKLGKTTVGELGSTIGSVIPTAAAYHVNMANISSAMVEMTKQGINTANASTACQTYGNGMKIYANKLVVFSEEVYEKKSAVRTITRNDIIDGTFSARFDLIRQYTGCEYEYDVGDTHWTKSLYFVVKPEIKISVGQCDSEAEGLIKGKAKVNGANRDLQIITFQILGDPRMVSTATFNLSGFGGLDGKYYINKTVNTFSSSGGFTQEIEARRIQQRL